MKTARLLVVCAAVGLLASGCAKQDLALACDTAAEIIEMEGISNDEKARQFAVLLHERLSAFGAIRKDLMRAAALPIGQRYRHMRRVAAEHGLPDWECEPLRIVLEPDVLEERLHLDR